MKSLNWPTHIPQMSHFLAQWFNYIIRTQSISKEPPVRLCNQLQILHVTFPIASLNEETSDANTAEVDFKTFAPQPTGFQTPLEYARDADKQILLQRWQISFSSCSCENLFCTLNRCGFCLEHVNKGCVGKWVHLIFNSSVNEKIPSGLIGSCWPHEQPTRKCWRLIPHQLIIWLIILQSCDWCACVCVCVSLISVCMRLKAVWGVCGNGEKEMKEQ